MSESVKRTVHYECPNDCPNTCFFQIGISFQSRKFTEDGEIIEDEHYNFNPTVFVKCYQCRAKAIIRTKTVRTIITVE